MKKIIFAIVAWMLIVVAIAHASFVGSDAFNWEEDERISIEFIEGGEYFGPEERISIGDKYEVQVEYTYDLSGGWIIVVENVPTYSGDLYRTLYDSGLEPMNICELFTKMDEIVKKYLTLLDMKQI